jgi:putative polyketide hydroxylase
MPETHTPLLIIGGGIVGLSTSLFLSTHSIPHLLLERHPTTSIHPRARGLNTHAMEIFRSINISDAVREVGASLAPNMGICKGTSFFEVMDPMPRKEGERGAMPFAGLFEGVISPTKGVRCTQDMMEPVLVEVARERGGSCGIIHSARGLSRMERALLLHYLTEKITRLLRCMQSISLPLMEQGVLFARNSG